MCPQNQSQDKLHNKPAVRQQDDFTVDAGRLGKTGRKPGRRRGNEVRWGRREGAHDVDKDGGAKRNRRQNTNTANNMTTRITDPDNGPLLSPSQVCCTPRARASSGDSIHIGSADNLRLKYNFPFMKFGLKASKTQFLKVYLRIKTSTIDGI